MRSKTEENYIKQIFYLEDEHKKEVSTNLIASKMKTKASSVTDMLQKLATKDLVIYKKYKGVLLSDAGKKLALSVIRKHRLWETFLVEKLGFHWDEVHDIAEQLEHIQSEKLTNNLDKYLGYPRVDPHGGPIPDRNGKIVKIETRSLAQLKKEEEGIFVSLKDSSDAFLKFLSKNKITIGCLIKVIHKEPFDNSLKIEVDSAQFNISETVAKNLYLKL